MKTPRQILFQRHESAVGKLDRIRVDVLSNQRTDRQGTKRDEPNLFAAVMLKLWGELIWPCRHAWAGFVVVWIALSVINFATSKDSENARPLPSSSEIVAAFEQRRQLLAELLRPPPAKPTKVSPARPPQARGRRDMADWVV
jgi:hypothetical protein